MNIYYFVGFGVVAAVTFLVLRHLRFGPVISAACALGFTFLPYHFTHGRLTCGARRTTRSPSPPCS